MEYTVSATFSKADFEKSSRKPLPIDWSGIPDDLKQHDQWLLWRFGTVKDKAGNERRTKIPIFCCGRLLARAKSSDPSTWRKYDHVACQFELFNWWQEGRIDGIGFVMSKSDPFTSIDLDDA